jgi:hypothetical protein
MLGFGSLSVSLLGALRSYQGKHYVRPSQLAGETVCAVCSSQMVRSAVNSSVSGKPVEASKELSAWKTEI